MSTDLKIKISDFKFILNMLLNNIEDLVIDGDSINIDMDYYWCVDTFDWNDKIESNELGVGSLVDDWQELIKQVKDNERIFTSVDFERIGNIVRYLGYKKYKYP